MLKKVILGFALVNFACASSPGVGGKKPVSENPVRQSLDPVLRNSLEECISSCQENEKKTAKAILTMLMQTTGTADSKATIEPLAKLVAERLNLSRPGVSKEEVRGIYDYMNLTREYMRWFSDELKRQQKNAPPKN